MGSQNGQIWGPYLDRWGLDPGDRIGPEDPGWSKGVLPKIWDPGRDRYDGPGETPERGHI